METPPQDVRAATQDAIRAQMLIHAYRVRGHTQAALDPLELHPSEPHPDLHPATYGFAEGDLDRPIYLFYGLGLETATLREILATAREAYCGTLGAEFMHIQDPEAKSWVQEHLERVKDRRDFTPKFRKLILERLIAAESFERFLHKRFIGTKRFGLDGGEATIPALEQILLSSSRMGVAEIVIGMPHRGRLNVLANVMGKRLAAIFAEFRGVSSNPEEVGGSGDVKYHLGTSTDRRFEGRSIHLSLTANPSHLEAVYPVVEGLPMVLVSRNSPDSLWEKTVRSWPVLFAETRSSLPSPFRSAAATETGATVVAALPTTTGGVWNWPGLDWKNTVRLFPITFEETRSQSPSAFRSAATIWVGRSGVTPSPSMQSGRRRKLPESVWKNTVRRPLTMFVQARSIRSSSFRSTATREFGVASHSSRTRGLRSNWPGPDWKKTVRRPGPPLAVARSGRPSAFRSAITMARGTPVFPRTVGLVGYRPGPIWK
jgi:hypothetical protein